MAVTATDRSNVYHNSGIVDRLAQYLVEHGMSPGNAPLTNAQWISVVRISQASPNNCSENELLVSIKAMVDELQPA